MAEATEKQTAAPPPASRAADDGDDDGDVVELPAGEGRVAGGLGGVGEGAPRRRRLPNLLRPLGQEPRDLLLVRSPARIGAKPRELPRQVAGQN